MASWLLLRHPQLANVGSRELPVLREALEYRGWPVSTIFEDASREGRWLALQNGPCGRCIYACDNNVVDHQTVNIELQSGTTALLVMHGHSHREGRTVRYDGTRATLVGWFHATEQTIEIHDHLSGEVEIIHPLPAGSAAGHGGGDVGLMAAFVQAFRDRRSPVTSAREALESHLVALAAEEARLTGTVIDVSQRRQQAEQALFDSA